MHSQTKHIPIKYHFVREQVVENIVKLECVDTKEQIADIFINPLPRETFEYLRWKLGIVPYPNNMWWGIMAYISIYDVEMDYLWHGAQK